MDEREIAKVVVRGERRWPGVKVAPKAFAAHVRAVLSPGAPLAASLEAIVQPDRPRTRAPSHVSAVVLDVAHAFDAAGDDNVGRAGLNHHGCRDDCLQSAATTPV